MTFFGIPVDTWDLITFAAVAFSVFALLVTIILIAGLPGRIAVARNHPEAQAVTVMGYAGFLAAVPWINAFIWAFKPTNVIDIRRLPAAEAEATAEEITKLGGHPLLKKEPALNAIDEKIKYDQANELRDGIQ